MELDYSAKVIYIGMCRFLWHWHHGSGYGRDSSLLHTGDSISYIVTPAHSCKPNLGQDNLKSVVICRPKI